MEQKDILKKSKYSFPMTFWIANLLELIERLAYYSWYVVMTIYLFKIIGFTDIEKGYIFAFFSASIYFFPMISGTISDKINFRNGLLIAFGLLTVGYITMGLTPQIFGYSSSGNLGAEFFGFTLNKWSALFGLGCIMIGGSFIKPNITGTVSKTTSKGNSGLGFAIFYWMVNIGGFTGKLLADPMKKTFGEDYVPFISAISAMVGLICVFILYKDPTHDKTNTKTFKETFGNMLKIFTNFRLLIFLIIFGGYSTCNSILYSILPDYTTRIFKEDLEIGFLLNFNPLTIVLLQLIVASVLKKLRAINSIIFGLIMITGAMMILSNSIVNARIETFSINIFNFIIYDFNVMAELVILIGIMTVALSEMMTNPRALDFISGQAPKDQVGLYLGSYYICSFIGYGINGILSGYLLNHYCPDDGPRIYANYIWYYFAGIAVITILGLLTYKKVISIIDKKKLSYSNA